ncbi:hypothetical protein RchiOBHm_Chr5g0079831 [Rosa chinensis]|uniref:Uncharacterized protein n=1 Tax=Rosa chinensis TaxID=74649 RepID=A0A2P6QMK8_ROSCH|nr:hypothetical protein RchiOBHm_Chr5g0079831 [Rosa chinensis]
MCVLAAPTELSKRHADGSLPIEDFNIVLGNQSGKRVQMGSETDQRAIMMSLMLHTNAKQLIKAQNYQDAMEVLSMEEVCYWCLFATDSFVHMKFASYLACPCLLQQLLSPKLCGLYFLPFFHSCRRLSLSAIHRLLSWSIILLYCKSIWFGIHLEKAREGLERAHGKDSSRVRLLQAGCYPERALYLILELLEGVAAYHSGQVDKSVTVLTSAQEKFTQLQVVDESLFLVMIMGFRERDTKRALGMSNQDVSISPVYLLLKHYEEMTVEKALDLTNSSIQHLESRKSKLQCQAVDASVEAFVRMAFDRSLAILALQGGGTMDQAICQLLSGQAPNPTDAANQSEAIPAVNANNNGQSDVAIDIANSLASVLDNQNGQVGGFSTSSNASERDSERESQLAEELAQGDAFTDYDIEVNRKGEVISEYLA